MTKEEFIKTIPAELQVLNQWVLYKKEKKGSGKTDKLPINAVTGELAKSNDPNTWIDFQTALEWSGKRRLGIGFMFAGGYVGVDIDGCRNRETGELTEQAKDVLDTLKSYSEASPSGTGVHIICKGKLPPSGRRSGSLEMYDSGRFFTVTANVLTDYPKTVEERTKQLKTVHAKYIQKPEQIQQPVNKPCLDNGNLDCSDIVQKAISSKTGYKFKALYDGNWQGLYPSQSEADLGFCQMLAFWCAGDALKMDSIFRQSGLYREKWIKKHGADTYGNITLSEALRNCREFYIPEGQYTSKTKEKEPADLELINFSEVEVEEVEWLIKPYIPLAKLTNITGYPGEGKTTYALKLCADLSKQGVNSLYQSAEDGLSDTIKPRLLQFDADCRHIFAINDKEGTLTFRDDRLEKMMDKIQPKLVIFDPIQAFLGAGTDFHRANETRPVLSRLVGLAQKYKCAIVLIMHLAKGERKHSIYSSLGSADIPAAARSILLVGKDPNNPTSGAIIHIKSSLAAPGPAIGYRFTDDGFQLTGETSVTADTILNQTKSSTEDTKLNKAKELILSMLDGGKEVLAAQIYEKAEEIGISDVTMKRAKAQLRVKARKSGGFSNARWYWYIDEYQEDHSSLIRTELEMIPFTGKPDNTTSQEEYQRHPSDVSKSINDTDELIGGTLDNAQTDRRVSNISLFNTQLCCDEDDLPDWVREIQEEERRNECK